MRPGYAQNLFQVGQRIGQAPTTAVAIEQEKEKKRQLSAFDPNTVEGLGGLADYYQGQGDTANAVKYATAARTLRGQIEQKQKTTAKEREQEEARARLRGAAFQKAAREDDPTTAVGRVREMTLEQLMEYTQAEEREGYTLSPGAQRYSADGVLLSTAPTKPEKPTPPKIEVRLQGDDLVTFTNGVETNRTKPPEDLEKTKGAREAVATTAVQQMLVLEEAKRFITSKSKDASTPMGDPSGFFGGVLSAVPGTDAYTLENKYYQQIRGAEARRAIEEMKKTSEEYGSKGTGLGQITQIEFKTLMSNLIGLTTGLSTEDQLDSLDKMIANYERIQKLASGENIIDVVNFPPADADPTTLTREQQQYLKSGYVKEGGTLYYYPEGPDGPERVFNRETNKFE
jgi:hypothetical protein